jgi:hypothetical protein
MRLSSFLFATLLSAVFAHDSLVFNNYIIVFKEGSLQQSIDSLEADIVKYGVS